jgi:hypothetical protein
MHSAAGGKVQGHLIGSFERDLSPLHGLSLLPVNMKNLLGNATSFKFEAPASIRHRVCCGFIALTEAVTHRDNEHKS